MTVPRVLLATLVLAGFLMTAVRLQNCPKAKFDCKNGKCIRGTLWCDGTDNCGNGADENECNFCLGGALKCASSLRCVPSNARCNGSQECADRSDEADCPVVTTMTPNETANQGESAASFTGLSLAPTVLSALLPAIALLARHIQH